MFNVYNFEKKLAASDDLKKMKEDYVKDEGLRKKKQDKMVGNYKRRIENFVLQMADKPIVRHDDVASEKIKIRDEDPSKFLGSPNIIIRSFKHEKDRIQEAIEKNQEYRGGYVSAPFEFRKRDTSKEMHPQMRFATKSSLEKLSERINHLLQTSQSSPGAKSAGKLSDSLLIELSKSPQATNKYLAQHVLPELNTKTHFRAAECLYLSVPLNSLTTKNVKKDLFSTNAKGNTIGKAGTLANFDDLVDEQPAKSKAKLRTGLTTTFEDETADKKLTEKQSHLEVVDPQEVSKKVLLKCNVIHKKKGDAHNLGKGDGHLMAMSNLSNAEIYRHYYPGNKGMRSTSEGRN